MVVIVVAKEFRVRIRVPRLWLIVSLLLRLLKLIVRIVIVSTTRWVYEITIRSRTRGTVATQFRTHSLVRVSHIQLTVSLFNFLDQTLQFLHIDRETVTNSTIARTHIYTNPSVLAM